LAGSQPYYDAAAELFHPPAKQKSFHLFNDLLLLLFLLHSQNIQRFLEQICASRLPLIYIYVIFIYLHVGLC